MAGGPYGCVDVLRDTKLTACAGDGENADQIKISALKEKA